MDRHMKDIMLKITGMQFIGTESEDRMEFTTDGKLYEKNGDIYLVYYESELSGFPGCMTTLRLGGDSVRMKRIGKQALGAEMHFEPGKRMTSKYETPYGVFDMELLTNRVENRMQEEGVVTVEYHIALDGLVEGRNTLESRATPAAEGEEGWAERK